jgi:hypothetical protein
VQNCGINGHLNVHPPIYDVPHLQVLSLANLSIEGQGKVNHWDGWSGCVKPNDPEVKRVTIHLKAA